MAALAGSFFLSMSIAADNRHFVAACCLLICSLSTWHRFCVSGTPLARSPADLHGLLLFLGVPTYESKDVFTKLLLEPAEAGDVTARAALLRLVHCLMWRSRIADVQHELALPPLTEETITLRFSRIEEAFYRREFQRLAEKVEPVLNGWRNEERTKQAKLRQKAKGPSRVPLSSSSSSSAAAAAALGGDVEILEESSSSSASAGAGAGSSSSSSSSSSASSSSSSSSASSSSDSWLLGDLPLSKREAGKVLGPLLRLRQAAVHPQIGLMKGGGGASAAVGAGHRSGDVLGGRGAGGGGSGGGGGGIKSMGQVLADMIAKAQLECEDAQRSIVFALNGLAGLYWLQGKYDSAQACYQAVLDMSTAADNASKFASSSSSSSSSSADGASPSSSSSALALTSSGTPVIRVDILQRIHAIRNFLALQEARRSAAKSAGAGAAEGGVEESKTGEEQEASSSSAAVQTAQLSHVAASLEDGHVGAAGVLVIKEFAAIEKRGDGLLALLHLQPTASSSAGPVDTIDLTDSSTPSSSSSSSAAAAAASSISSSSNSLAPSPSQAPSFRRGVALPPHRLTSVYRRLAASTGPLLQVLQVVAVHVLDPLLTSPLGDTSKEGEAIIGAARGTGVLTAAEREDMMKKSHAAGGAAVAWPVSGLNAVKMKLLQSLTQLAESRRRALLAMATILHPSERDLRLNADCGQCRSDFGKKGEMCPSCKAEGVIKAYMLHLTGFRSSTMASEKMAEDAETQAAKRAQRRGKRAVPGASGDLTSFLQASAAAAPDDAALAAAVEGLDERGGAKGPRKDKEVPTACVRVMAALAKVSGGAEIDIADVLAAAVKQQGSSSSTASDIADSNSGAGAGAGAGSSSSSSASSAALSPSSLTLQPVKVRIIYDDSDGSDSEDDEDDGLNASASSSSRQQQRGSSMVIKLGEWVPRVLDSLADECRELSALWRVQADLLSSIDELHMSYVRAELAPDDADISEAESAYRVKEYELPARVASLASLRVSSEADLRKHLSYLKYLLHIQKEDAAGGSGGGRSGGAGAGAAGLRQNASDPSGSNGSSAAAAAAASSADEVCRICLGPLGGASGRAFVLTTCAHRFCSVHFKAIHEQATARHPIFGRSGTLKCPLCRTAFEKSDVAHVNLKAVAGASDVSEGPVSTLSAADPSSASAVADVAAAASNHGAGMQVDEDKADLSSSSSSSAAAAVGSDETSPPHVSGTLSFLFTNNNSSNIVGHLLGSAQPQLELAATSAAGDLEEEDLVGSDSSPSNGLTEVEAEKQLSVAGSYGTKIEALVKCVKALLLQQRLQDSSNSNNGSADATGNAASSSSSSSSALVPSSQQQQQQQHGRRPLQCLVFSQWDDALSIAQAALVRNGVKVLRMTSAKAAADVVERFIADLGWTVLLMPFKTGYAEGLNLTNATHVFLLEPLLEPAMKRQAIGRVYRMGQWQPTFAHELVVEGSIEEHCTRLAASRAQRSATSSSTIPQAAREGDEEEDDGGDTASAALQEQLRHHTQHYLSSLAQAQVGFHRRKATDSKASDTDDVSGGGSGAAHGGPHAGKDDAGITRRDVIRMFEAEQRFARQLEDALLGRQAPAASSGAAAALAPSADAAVGADGAPAEGEDGEGESLEDAKAAAAELKAAAERLKLHSRRNFLFWTFQRVQHNGRAQIRMAILPSLLWAEKGSDNGSAGNPSSASAAAAPEATVTMFGREVPRSVALRLLQLPCEPDKRAADVVSQTLGAGAAPAALAKAVKAEEAAREALAEEAQRLLQQLAAEL